MEKDNYSLKEIIFSLRNEYLKIQEQLKELESCIEKNNNIIAKFDLFVTKENNEIKILGNMYEQKNKIISYMYELAKIIDSYGICIQKVGNEYKLAGNRYYLWVPQLTKQIFNNIADSIFNSNFLKNIDNDIFISEYMDKNLINGEISTYTNDIYASLILRDINSLVELNYNSIGDTISFKNSNEPQNKLSFKKYKNKRVLTSEVLYCLFNIQIPKSLIPKHIQEIIEKNNYLNKKIEIVGETTPNIFKKFEIIEEEKKLVLKRTYE